MLSILLTIILLVQAGNASISQAILPMTTSVINEDPDYSLVEDALNISAMEHAINATYDVYIKTFDEVIENMANDSAHKAYQSQFSLSPQPLANETVSLEETFLITDIYKNYYKECMHFLAYHDIVDAAVNTNQNFFMLNETNNHIWLNESSGLTITNDTEADISNVDLLLNTLDNTFFKLVQTLNPDQTITKRRYSFSFLLKPSKNSITSVDDAVSPGVPPPSNPVDLPNIANAEHPPIQIPQRPNIPSIPTFPEPSIPGTRKTPSQYNEDLRKASDTSSETPKKPTQDKEYTLEEFVRKKITKPYKQVIKAVDIHMKYRNHPVVKLVGPVAAAKYGLKAYSGYLKTKKTFGFSKKTRIKAAKKLKKLKENKENIENYVSGYEYIAQQYKKLTDMLDYICCAQCSCY